MSIPKRDVNSWLLKQASKQIHILPPKEINHPHYKVTKTNEQHQFDLLCVPHNVFKGNTYKYILTGVNVTSRNKVATALGPKKEARLDFVLEAIYQSDRVFKYLNLSQWDNESEFKSDVTGCFFDRVA